MSFAKLRCCLDITRQSRGVALITPSRHFPVTAESSYNIESGGITQFSPLVHDLTNHVVLLLTIKDSSRVKLLMTLSS